MRGPNRRQVLLGLLAGLGAPGLLRAEGTRLAGADPAAAAISRAALDGQVAYAVIDLASGLLLDARHADLMLPPASTLKSVTALYAQARLGRDHRFVTRVIRDGAGGLVLAGGGDPELDSDGLADLARQTVAAYKASGHAAPARFEVWGGALPQIARISARQAEHLPYNPTISGMILNYNRVHLGWQKAGADYRISLQARGGRQSPRAYTVGVTTADRAAPLFTYDDHGPREEWTMARRAMGQSGSRWLPVRRPELYTGDVFQTLCRAEGLVLPAPQVAATPPEGEEVARRDSGPLHQILAGMMEYSNNLTAEVVGLAASGAADLGDSGRAMENWLRAQNVAGAFHFADHSGLSPQSRVSAGMMAGVMARQGHQQGLRALMRHIRLRDARGKEIDSPISVDAKTGTLNFLSNLAGYVEDGSGAGQGQPPGPLAFAIMTVNEPRRLASEGQELPEGVIGWTRQSKALQQTLIETWVEARRPPGFGAADGVSGAVSPARRPTARPARDAGAISDPD